MLTDDDAVTFDAPVAQTASLGLKQSAVRFQQIDPTCSLLNHRDPSCCAGALAGGVLGPGRHCRRWLLG